MLAADVQITDIDGAHWANWQGIFMPPRLRHQPRWALLVRERGALAKAIIAGPGGGAKNPASVPLAGTTGDDLRRLVQELAVEAVVVVDREVVPTVLAEIDRSLALGDDYVAQCLVIVRALKRHSGRGIWSEPSILDLVPPMSYEALQGTFDLLIPDRSSMVAYVMEDGGADVHASLIAVKRRGHIELVTTHLALADVLRGPILAQGWRKSYRRVLDLVAERFERPSLAAFLERQTLIDIMRGPGDRLAREINARNLIIDPAPAWLLGLLGGATVAAVASRGARALAMMLPAPARKMATDLAYSAHAAVRDRTGSPFALLGFDPIELWRSMRHFYRHHD